MQQGAAQPAPDAQPEGGAQPGAKPGAQPGQSDPRVEFVQRVVVAAGKIVYEKNTAAQLVRMVKSAEDPVAGVAQATLLVLDRVQSQVKGRDPKFVFVAVPSVVRMILELADAAKIVKSDDAVSSQAVQAVAALVKQRFGQQGAQPPAQAAPAQGAPPAQPQPPGAAAAPDMEA